MPKRKVVASVSFTIPDDVKKGELRQFIKKILESSVFAEVTGTRVNFDQWGGETIVKKSPAKTKRRVLQAGKGKAKGKGKGKPNKPAKKAVTVKRAYTKFPKETVNGVGGISIETEL